MKLRSFAIMAAVLAIPALFVACGGDDDDGGDSTRNLDSSAIHVDKGPQVAALAAELGVNFGNSNQQSGDDTAESNIAKRDGSATAAGPAQDLARSAYGGDLAYPYSPTLQGGGVGLTVEGYGSASATADSAVVEMYFYRDGYTDKPIPLPEPLPPEDTDAGSANGSDGSVSPDDIYVTPGTVEPITEADLAPVIAALAAAGGDVEFVEQPYFDSYYANATLRATFDNLDAVDGAIESATNAANGLTDIFFSGTNQYYTVSDCSALERAAMEAALEDAGEQGDVLADVIGVTKGEILGASTYSYAPYDDGSCSSSYYYGYPVTEDGSGGNSASEVQVFASMVITYAIQ